MPVVDPAPPPVRPSRGASPDVAAALAAHSRRTGLNLSAFLTGPGTAGRPSVREVAPGMLEINLPLPEAGAGVAASGLIPVGDGSLDDPAAAVRRLLELSGDCAAGRARLGAQEHELEDVTEQLSQSFEELALYQRLTGLMQITRDPGAFAAECAEEALRTADVDAGAVLLRGGGDRELRPAGAPLFNAVRLERLARSRPEHDWARPLVLNGAAAPWRGVGSVVLARVERGDAHYGWIACAVLEGGRELGSTEGNLLSVVATVLATHLKNQGLFREKEQMLLEFVLGLVQTLEARDPYTRGHSERVAVVAHRIARELGLSQTELDNLYLSGLLHDIGKVGIDDRVLRKPGKLTDEEFDQIKQHPRIGYEILAGISGLQEILPGVRNHHEFFNGAGYPDGLAGEAIPQMARIMAVADAYDAMGSDRPYRAGMPLGKIEGILRGGGGEQWDPAALEAYFACSEDVRRLWSAPYDSAARLADRAKRRLNGGSAG